MNLREDERATVARRIIVPHAATPRDTGIGCVPPEVSADVQLSFLVANAQLAEALLHDTHHLEGVVQGHGG